MDHTTPPVICHFIPVEMAVVEHHLPPLSSPSSEAAAEAASAPARPLRGPHEPDAASAAASAAAAVPLPLFLLVEPVVAVPVVPLGGDGSGAGGGGARGRAPLLAPLRLVVRVGPLSVVVEIVAPKTWKDLSAFLQLLRQVKWQIALCD